MLLVLNVSATRPLILIVVTIASMSAPVTIHGPIGLNVSQFLARQSVRSFACQVRSLTSLPMVQPNT
jgi:hypothetical protein